MSRILSSSISDDKNKAFLNSWLTEYELILRCIFTNLISLISKFEHSVKQLHYSNRINHGPPGLRAT